MSMMRSVLVGIAGVIVLTASPAAWSAGVAPSVENLALAKRYVTAIHMDHQMDGMMKSIMPALTAQTGKGTQLTPEQQQIVAEVAIDATKGFVGKMMDRMTPIFAATFTTQELQGLVAFYEGPTGQSMMAKTPELMKNMTPMMMELMPQMQADMRQHLCARLDCTALGKPIASPKPS